MSRVQNKEQFNAKIKSISTQLKEVMGYHRRNYFLTASYLNEVGVVTENEKTNEQTNKRTNKKQINEQTNYRGW